MKTYKKLLFMVLLALLITSTPAFAAQNDIKVIVSGTEVVFPDQQPVIIDERVFVPIRGVFELLVPETANKDEIFTVSWNEKTSTATIKNKWYTVTITSGQNTFEVNGKTITPDVPPQIVNNRFMIPLRAISDAVDAQVDWDGANHIAKIYYVPQVKVEKK